MRRAWAARTLAAAAAVLLAGCGHGDERAIVGVVKAGLTSQDPHTVCEGSLTPALLTRIYGGVRECQLTESETSERISQAQSVEVKGVRVQRHRATAVVVIHGGYHDGARGTLTLGHRGEGWRVSDLSAELLRSQFEVTLRRLHGPDQLTKECIIAKMRELGDVAFKRLAFDAGSGGKRRLNVVAARCHALIAAAARMRV
jgi:hypothetical protein